MRCPPLCLDHSGLESWDEAAEEWLPLHLPDLRLCDRHSCEVSDFRQKGHVLNRNQRDSVGVDSGICTEPVSHAFIRCSPFCLDCCGLEMLVRGCGNIPKMSFNNLYVDRLGLAISNRIDWLIR